MPSFRHTKIVATLGPSSNNPEIIHQLCCSGVNIFRLNFSHGNHEDHKHAVENIRQAEKTLEHPIAIMLDLQGPKLRVGTFKNTVVPLHVHQKFQLDLDPTPGDNNRVYFGYPDIIKSLIPGTDILIDDGKVLLRVDELFNDRLTGTILSGIEISDRKGVNLPSVCLSIDAMTSKDTEDLSFGLALGVDWIAISFVQTADDIKRARVNVPGHIKIVAKIEKPLAIQNIDTIIEAADGIMIARGDLGVEVPLELVPSIQKQILKKCHFWGKPVIVATQMLDSMITAPTPTRAEVSDVANAVYDGADAVMLSAESASGQHPVKAVQMMDRIIRQVEKDPQYLEKIPSQFNENVCSPITSVVPQLVDRSRASIIATISFSGNTALRLSRERPNVPIVALTFEEHTARYLCLVWGVYPLQIHSTNCYSVEDWQKLIRRTMLETKLTNSNDKIIVVGGVSTICQPSFVSVIDS
ncbi:MAG: pyruvate kinase [Holosporales bacterium]|nr:pyruvate kinase [Holosporales bacterium]